MNSGMNRLGFAPQRFRAAWTRLDALPQVDEISLMTHFSDADGPRGIAHQVRCSSEATRDLPGERIAVQQRRQPAPCGATPAVRADWIRPGIAVYGSAPDYPEHDIAHWELQPDDDAGHAASSACSSCSPATRWATAPASRPTRRCASASSPAAMPTATRATAAPARRCWWTACAPASSGRVSMDMITVDLTPVPQAGFGSEVTLWGRAGNGAVLAIDEVGARRRHAGLRADVRAGAAGAGGGRMNSGR